jgi:hypothetical protein
VTFHDPLLLEYMDGKKWKIIHSFSYKPKHGDAITVPSGFVTDFASVPRFFWRLFPPTGKYGKAAVIHDFLYAFNGVSRERADAIFLEAMTDLGVDSLTRHLLWLAVRGFGWVPWRTYRKVVNGVG